MDLGSWTRRTGFWAVDALKGSPIRHHYDDIRAKMAGQGDADEQLGRLLEHATRTTSFYAPLAGRGLADFPVIDRAFCRQHIGELRSSAFSDGQLRSVSTSGSTGTPLTVHQDRSKRQRTVADLIYVHEAAGLALGEKLMWIHEWSSVTAKSRLGELLQNVVSVRQATLDARGEDEVIVRLRRDRVRGLLAYGSELWSLARRIEERHPDARGSFGLSVVLSHADDLAPGTRARIRAAFGAPVVDRYSNSENGILAWTRPDEDDFQLNRASFRFELLRLDSDEPSAPGELARVVLTDLYDLATPLIRYDTGDLAIVGDGGPGGPTTIRSLEGRRSEPGLGQPGPAGLASDGHLRHERLPRPAGVAVHPGAPGQLPRARHHRGCQAGPRRARSRPAQRARCRCPGLGRAGRAHPAASQPEVPGHHRGGWLDLRRIARRRRRPGSPVRFSPGTSRAGYRPLRRLLVSTTSKSRPLMPWRVWSASSSQRASGAPVTYQGEPLSARIMP